MAAQALDLLTAAPVELAERRLRHFLRQAWHVIEPFTVFKPNWHIDAICDHLEAVERGEIRNLLVTMPPRMLKSLTISVFYPAWCWTRAPGMRFLYASYSQDLATVHSLATRRVIESDWYQARWGDRFQLAGDANLKTRFENDQRGARYSTSVGGVVTGIGADRLVVDDAHNVRDAESEAVREATLRWWDQAMSTRLNDPRTGARIVVMQRVHEADLAGHLIEQGGYVHLNLPMEYEPETVHFTGFGQPDPRTEPGELLAPDRVGPAEIADLKLRLGSRAYAGQFQQRPAPAEGATLKAGWWEYWDPSAPLPPMDWLLQDWDTAFKTGQENDYSVGLTVGLSGGRIYVLDRWRDRVEFPQLKRAVASQYLKWRPDEVIVEDKASGQSLIQELAQEVELGSGQGGVLIPVVAFNPGSNDKRQRASTASPYVEARRVLLPAGAPWVQEFVDECAMFPAGRHDDQVDAIVMAILRLRDRMPFTRPLDPGLVAAFADLPG
ncbi:MAG: phage terminase large subunit [Thermomicrobiales bacterium]|nr:phage terminase large subunit [Thermomicrobiales bacterium]